MHSLFLHPGKGKVLRQVTGATGNTLVVPDVLDIPNNGYSEIFSGHDGRQIMLEFVFGASAIGDVVIEKVADQFATVAGTAYAATTATNELSKDWSATTPLIGSFRIKNTTGQTVRAYYNNLIR